MINIEIWASGKGSNAANIINHFKGNLGFNVSLLAANRSKSGVFQMGLENEIETLLFSKEYWQSSSLLSDLKRRNPDVIILAGFLKLVPEQIVETFKGRMLNIHPSLLPSFGGEGMYGDNVHAAVLESKAEITGITIHEIDAEFDKGKIVAQFSTAVSENDSLADVKSRIQALEKNYFPMTIEHWAQSI